MRANVERAMLAAWGLALAGLAAAASGIVRGEGPLWGLAAVWGLHALARAARLLPAR